MQKTISALALIAFAAAFGATPTVVENSVRFDQDDMHFVTISYDLADADAVVTVDIRTNGVSIGDVNLRGFVGECSKVTEAGTDRQITWHPDRYWPDGKKIAGDIVTVRLKAYPTCSPPNYMVVDMLGTKTVRYYESEGCLPGGVESLIYL